MDNNGKASLGCGTLILIALIVMFFAGGDDVRMHKKADDLQKSINDLNKKVDNLTTELEEIKRLIEK